MTRFISYLASLFIVTNILIVLLALTSGITWQMAILFPIVSLLSWRLTRAANNLKTADKRRRYYEHAVALRAFQDEQGADKM